MKRLGYGVSEPTKEESETPDELKIFYCSRTHSQLSQFAGELRKVKIPPVVSQDDGDDTAKSDDNSHLEEEFKYLTMGSRKNLCINPKVNRLGNASAINERCLELQQPKTSSDQKCPYLPTKETEAVVNDFRDHAIAKIRDIEDLGALGKKLGICPYYASRPAVRPCEVTIASNFFRIYV
jgi:chromosome transmission fidelity protein 1